MIEKKKERKAELVGLLGGIFGTTVVLYLALILPLQSQPQSCDCNCTAKELNDCWDYVEGKLSGEHDLYVRVWNLGEKLFRDYRLCRVAYVCVDPAECEKWLGRTLAGEELDYVRTTCLVGKFDDEYAKEFIR